MAFNNDPKQDDYNIIDSIDDEIDCAILNDENFEKALHSEELELSDINEPVDVNIDYTDDIVGATEEDIAADDIIAAERDIAYNPFEDDDLLDDILSDDEDYEESL